MSNRSSTGRSGPSHRRAAGILRDIAPLAAGAQRIHHGFGHLAHVCRPLAAAALGKRDQRHDIVLSGIRGLTRVAQLIGAGVASVQPLGPRAGNQLK